MARVLAGITPDAVILSDIPAVKLATKQVKCGEKAFMLYSIGHLAMAIHRSTDTIRRWQRKKLLPAPVIRTADGARWYLKEEIELYRRLSLAHNLRTGMSIEGTGFTVEAFAESQKIHRAIQNMAKGVKS